MFFYKSRSRAFHFTVQNLSTISIRTGVGCSLAWFTVKSLSFSCNCHATVQDLKCLSVFALVWSQGSCKNTHILIISACFEFSLSLALYWWIIKEKTFMTSERHCWLILLITKVVADAKYHLKCSFKQFKMTEDFHCDSLFMWKKTVGIFTQSSTSPWCNRLFLTNSNLKTKQLDWETPKEKQNIEDRVKE